MKKKKAFSLIEALIMMVILGIMIAASTPIITRKILNNAEGGATLGGGNHGRYEFYTKEVLRFGSQEYEKVADNSSSNYTIVYEKVENTPTRTVYEEITGLTPVKEKNGVVSEAKGFDKKTGKQKLFKRSNRYIFEDGKTTYKVGTSKNSPLINPNLNRIIESNLTVFDGTSVLGYKRWKLTKKCDEVKKIPQERLYSGSKEVYDREVTAKKTCPSGKGQCAYAKFTPPDNAVDLVIHAVGGGGAGGGPSEASIKNATEGAGMRGGLLTEPQARQLLTTLIGRVPKLGWTAKNINRDTSNGNMGVSVGNDIEGPKIKLRLDGILEVSIDVRDDYNDWIFPQDLLKFTDHLGTSSQEADTLSMPEWINWETIKNSGFESGAVACDGKGGTAGTVTWQTNDSTSDFVGCMLGVFGASCGGVGNNVQYCGECTEPGATCTGTYSKTVKKQGTGTGRWQPDGTCAPHGGRGYRCEYTYEYDSTENYDCNSSSSYCATMHCWVPNVDTTYITCGDTNAFDNKGSCSGSCTEDNQTPSSSDAGSCGTSNCYRNSTKYDHNYIGGTGGPASDPPCTYISTKVDHPIKIEYWCDTHEGTDGVGQTILPTGATGQITATDGDNGKSCYIKVDNKSASAIGGTGGEVCSQTSWSYSAPGVGMSGSVDPKNNSGPDNVPHKESKTSWILDATWMCAATHDLKCGKDGQPGRLEGDGQGCYGPPKKGIALETGIYNERYTWQIPYTVKYLGYGEAGEPGHYDSTKLPKVKGTLEITLGEGGTWKNNDWQKGKDGPNGTDTVVSLVSSIFNKKVLVAKGGKGGKGALNTGKFDLCFQGFVNTGKTCALYSDKNANGLNSTVATKPCCTDIDERTTKEIKSTIPIPSEFDNIKSFVQNSSIVGVGLGRSGEGAGMRTGLQGASGDLLLYNSSYNTIHKAGLSFSERNIKSVQITTGSAPASSYDNEYLEPAALNLKGGDGAVIITW